MKHFMWVGLFLSAILLFGCLGLGETTKKETDYIPEKADMYMIADSAAMNSDPDMVKLFDDVMELYGGLVPGDWKATQLATKKSVAFMSFQGLTMEKMALGEYYVGSVSFGDFNEKKTIEALREKYELTEEQFEGVTIYKYKVSNDKIATESQTFGNQRSIEVQFATSFLDSKTKVEGTIDAIKDVIEVSKGKKKPLNDASLDRVASEAGFGSMVVLAARIPSSFEKAFTDLQKTNTGPMEVSSIGKMTHIALSYHKSGPVFSIKTAALFKETKDAEKTKDLASGLLSMYRGISKQGSALEQLLESIKVESKDSMMTITIETTKETLEKLQKEMGEVTGGTSPIEATGFSVIRPVAWNFQGAGYGTKNTLYATQATVVFSNIAGIDLMIAVNGTYNSKNKVILFSKPGASSCGWSGPVSITDEIGSKVDVRWNAGKEYGIVALPAGKQLVVSGMVAGFEGPQAVRYTCGGPSGGAYRWTISYQTALDAYNIQHSDAGIVTGKFQ
ncbi:MAG: hypothetical protein V1909_02435 [Candidatus Micrarchaeota archaeon]